MAEVTKAKEKIIKSIIDNNKTGRCKLVKCILECLEDDSGGYFLENGDLYILYKTEKQYNNLIDFLIESLIVVDYLKTEGYIYLIEDKESSYILIGGETSYEVGILNESRKYQYKDCEFSVSKDEVFYKDYKSIKCSKFLSSRIIDIYSSYVYSTSSLENFLKNGFKTIDEISLENQLEAEKINAKEARFSRNIAWLTLGVSLFIAPVVSLLINNKWGQSTLVNEQYVSIFKKVDSCSLLMDKIYTDLDTIKIRENEISLKKVKNSKISKNKK